MNDPQTLIEAVRHFSDLNVCDESPERWLPVVGNPWYEISNLGRVRSVARRVAFGHGWRNIVPEIRALRPNDAGYLTVVLSTPKGQSMEYVHRLVLLAFAGPCPDGMEARHFPDGDPANNRLENLSWASHSTNIGDRKTHGTSPDGMRHTSAKLTDEDVREIKRRLATGESRSSIARDFPVCRKVVQNIEHGRAWAHVI